MVSYHAPAWGFGGPVRMMFDYAQWMKDQFAVRVFAGNINHDYGKYEAKEETLEGIVIRRYHVFFRSMVRRSIILTSPRLFFDVCKIVKSAHKTTILHVCELRGPINIYAALLKKLFGRKILLVHSAFGMLHDKKSLFRDIYDLLFMKFFLHHIDLALAQNQHEIIEYNRFFSKYHLNPGSKIKLLHLHTRHLSSDSPAGSSSPKNPEVVAGLRIKYGVNKDADVMMFLGRLHPGKGIMRAIDTFVEYSKQSRKPCQLLIVGRDEGFQHDVERYISSRHLGNQIRIVNNVFDNRFDYYTLADVFLGFPTIYEETMLASVEALSCGTPILVSKEADIPFVEEEGAGFVVDYHVETTVKILEQIFQSLPNFQQKAFNAVRHHFAAPQASDLMKNIFTEKMSELNA